MKRSGSGSLPGAETRLSTQLHHLACATLDGHVVTWRVSLNASTASCDCVKTSEVELRDVFRQFDTVNGIHELKLHPQHDVMTAACRDGTIFFFDVAPLLDSNKPYVLAKYLAPGFMEPGLTVARAQSNPYRASPVQQAPRPSGVTWGPERVLYSPLDVPFALHGTFGLSFAWFHLSFSPYGLRRWCFKLLVSDIVAKGRYSGRTTCRPSSPSSQPPVPKSPETFARSSIRYVRDLAKRMGLC